MYKWHVHSAIGRSRPLAGDVARVTDGIAASLRSFHVSTLRAAEDGRDSGALRISRTQRSAAAVAEISSLSGGIDARSLAAKPPAAFTIRRVDISDRTQIWPGTGRGIQRQDSAMRVPRGGRNGSRGMSARGQRGGMQGRGRGRGRGRGGASRGGGARKRGPRGPSDDSAGFQNGYPLTAEEQAYVDSIEMGVELPATVGITNREALERDVPALATHKAPIGVVETIRDHMRTLAGQHGNEVLSSQEHSIRYRDGNGTFFVNDEDKARAISPERSKNTPNKYYRLGAEERQAILQTLVQGEYQPVKPIVKGDTIGAIDTYTQKNETYLPKDGAALKARVQRLLPAQSQARPQKQVAA